MVSKNNFCEMVGKFFKVVGVMIDTWQLFWHHDTMLSTNSFATENVCVTRRSIYVYSMVEEVLITQNKSFQKYITDL